MISIRQPVQGVRFVGQAWLENALVVITGLSFGALPEAGLVLGCFCGAWGVLRFGERWRPRDFLLAAFAISRLVYAFRSQGSILVALLEALVMLLLPRAVWVLSPAFGRLFGWLILLGLCFPIGVAMSRVLIPQTDVWSVDPTLALEKRLGDVRKFTPIHSGNAWVLNVLGVQGSGLVEYTFEVRTDRAIELPIFLLHQGLQGGRNKVGCQAGPVWRTCHITAVLPKPDPLIFGLGGYGLWKKGSPAVSIRSPRLQYLTVRNSLEQFQIFSRQMGPSFNENAFGAWVVVMSLLALSAIRDPRAVFLAVLPMFLAIYLSGSRGAMFSGVVGLLTYVLVRGRFLKLLLPLVVFGLIGAFFVQVYLDRGVVAPVVASSDLSLRAFQLDEAGRQSRLEIWQGALRESLLEPVIGPLRLTPGTGPLRAHVFDALPHAHNLWIEMLIEGGVIQLALAVAVFCSLLFSLVMSRNLLWFPVLVSVVLINFGDFLFYYAPIRLCFGLMLGLGFRYQVFRQRETTSVLPLAQVV